jgi:uncharacterized membrane protein
LRCANSIVLCISKYFRLQNIFRFNVWYFGFSILLFGVEVFIAARMNDTIIRPYGGDFLVVILLYCMVRTICDLPVLITAVSVLLFAWLVETSQYFHLADRLGLGAHSLARMLLGSYFSWTDMLSYTLGILLVLGVEKALKINL